MKCDRCQHDNPQGARFCEECATPLARSCSNCGTPLSAKAKFCHACAHPVAASAGTQLRSPDSYTPKHLAEKILTSRSALEGERKQVTVLFADLKGSMELLADRDPEEARKILDPVLELIMEAVHRYEGTVNQVMGDGIMALFGAPIGHEDHAVRGCYAALRMQESVKRYAEELRRSEGIPVQIRVGLNSGEVVVRSIGSDLRMDYTAVGQTTHLAARLEQMALPGSILISAGSLRLAEGYAEVKPLGPMSVKGLIEPVEVYEVTGAGAARTRLQATVSRGLSRFVGRDEEIEQLRRALQKAGEGHGQVVAVVGEPGVGKSRLYYEFIHSHRTQGWLVLESGSVSYGRATAYLPVVGLLKAYFKIHDHDDHREIREKVTGKLLTLEEALKPLLPAVLALLDVPVEDGQWQVLDPPQRRERTLDAVKRLLLRESLVQPVLLLFEDLHWIDSETQTVLDSLVESAPSMRVLLLVNYRPEYQPGWGSNTYYTQLRMDPLPTARAEELFHALLGDDESLRPLRALLVERTEGNPFFLEESIRTLLETHALAGERGAYRIVTDLTTIQVAPSVQAVLAARIDRLPREEKRLLQAASVIGKNVPFALLQAIAGLSEDGLRRGLTHLQAAEFLSEMKLFPDLEYSFKHALSQEVAYGSILLERRRTLHTAIVEILERLSGDRLTEHLEMLAHHTLRGELWEKALTYFRRAGAKALARGAPREALVCFEEASAALGHIPERREILEQAVDLRFELYGALSMLGEHERVLRHLREAEALAERLDDRWRLGRAHARLTTHFWLMGDLDRALESGEQAATIAAAVGDLGLKVEANLILGQVHTTRGGTRRAIEFFTTNVGILQGELLRAQPGMVGAAVLSRVWLSYCLGAYGEFQAAVAVGEEARGIAESFDSPFGLIGACNAIGMAHLFRGDVKAAVLVLERGLELCRSHGFGAWLPPIASSLGQAYVMAGRVSEGVALQEEAVEASRTRNRADEVGRMSRLSMAYLLAGRRAEATSLAHRALELARGQKQRGPEATVLFVLGQIAAQREPPEVEIAETYYRQAIALAEELGLRPLLGRSHLGLGTLYRRTGKRQQAQQHLITATAMFRDMGMTYWLEKAEAEVSDPRTTS
jgi:class 3 adenylate cyclase/tetratricopeptide (TPR) repeat protein